MLAQFIGLKKLIFLLKSYKNKPTLPRAIWDPLTHLAKLIFSEGGEIRQKGNKNTTAEKQYFFSEMGKIFARNLWNLTAP